MRAVQLLRSIPGCCVPFKKHLRTGAIVLVSTVAGIGGAVLLDWAVPGLLPIEWRYPPAGPVESVYRTPPLPAPAIGELAPDFVLPQVGGGPDIQLKTLLGAKPVVLVFGSFSCDTFHSHISDLTSLHKSWKNRVEFLFVNVREAGHRIPDLEFLLPTPQEDPSLTPEELPWEEHRQAVGKALSLTKLPFPAVIEPHDHKTMHAYGAYPIGLVIVDREGKIALDLGRGIEKQWDLHKVET